MTSAAGRLIMRLLGVRERETPVYGTLESGSSEAVDSKVTDAEQALERIREKYHKGTQPLTVAKAKVSLMARHLPEQPDGHWERQRR